MLNGYYLSTPYEYILAKSGVNTPKNESSKVSPISEIVRAGYVSRSFLEIAFVFRMGHQDYRVNPTSDQYLCESLLADHGILLEMLFSRFQQVSAFSTGDILFNRCQSHG